MKSQKAVGGAADEVAPMFAALQRAVLSVSVTYCTPHCGQSLSHCEGVMWAYLCASVCIFQLVTNAGEIQMSQNYQCPM